MDSLPTSFSEYLEMTSRLRVEASVNKKVCINRGISFLLYTAFFIVFFCSIEIGTWIEKFQNTSLVFGVISIGIWFFRWHWSTITQLGFLGMIFYIMRKLFVCFIAVLFFGGIICIAIEHFFTIPAWVTTPETRQIAIYIVCIIITVTTFILLLYHFVASCIYQKAIKTRLDLLTTWYEAHSLDLIDAENQKHHI